MKSLITLILTIALSAPIFGQYSENLDTLSRKEIRKMILNQNVSKKANSLMTLHQGAKFFSILSYSIGILGIASGEAPANDQEVNMAGILGAMAIGVGAVFTIISETSYYSSVQAYKKSASPSTALNKVHLRNSQDIFKEINISN